MIVTMLYTRASDLIHLTAEGLNSFINLSYQPPGSQTLAITFLLLVIFDTVVR